MAFWLEHVTKGGVPVVTWMATQVAKAEFSHYQKEAANGTRNTEDEVTVS